MMAARTKPKRVNKRIDWMNLFARVLIVDTSGRVGSVALGESERIVDVRTLSEARRHARDLPARIKEMLTARGWKARDITSAVISAGPGSYTGLRVGCAAVKALVFATDCALFAVPTFDAIALAIEPGDFNLAVIADAQQGNVYAADYAWSASAGWRLTGPIAILVARDWAGRLKKSTCVTGPGLDIVRAMLPSDIVALEGGREVSPASLLVAAQTRAEEYRTSPWILEPIYLRGSSAEEKRKRALEAPAS